MKTIRFGIIGCGDVTEVKSGPAFQKVPGAQLSMVMRRDEAKLIDYAKRHGVPAYSTDYLDVLTNPDIDAVYIATPPHMHAFYTLEAAKYGKAVYVEKPMARSVEECKQMVTACKKAGQPLYVAYYRRGQPKFVKAAQLLQDGAIGAVHSFSYLYASPPLVYSAQRPWLMDKERSGGGLMYDVGSHMVDMLLYLLGTPLDVVAYSANLGRVYDVEDTCSALFRFESGAQGTAQFSFGATQPADCLLILGSRGSMKLSIMNNDPLEVVREGKMEQIAFEPMAHVQQPWIHLVVRALQGVEPMDATGESGLLTQEILQTIASGGSWSGRRRAL